ncbi:alpha/beta hydrolase domain-containing protein 17C-like [Pseudophryne corroboree]|uniref:alpha/beta hydrolase domain-containing protein 17C-like n=1 Tax=Pseudophryne corroboree TaxID=495146 RepID=UPI003081AC00
MLGLSWRRLFSIFCCPPSLSSITAKLSFQPPEPSYTLQEIEAPPAQDVAQDERVDPTVSLPPICSLHLSESVNCLYSQWDLDMVEMFRCITKRGNSLACMYIRCAPGSRYTLLYSHGSNTDLGQVCSHYIALGCRIGCNIFSYDYSGFGMSSGRPSEKNIYADIEAAWHALRTRYGVPPENIILYGYSIGSAPSIDLATRYNCAAIILHSALMSAMRIAFPHIRRTFCYNPFPNIKKISKVTCPVLIIHGTEDENIDFSHGLGLYEYCPQAVEPLWVIGGNHYNLHHYAQYEERLQHFIYQELPFIYQELPNP